MCDFYQSVLMLLSNDVLQVIMYLIMRALTIFPFDNQLPILGVRIESRVFVVLFTLSPANYYSVKVSELTMSNELSEQ